MVCLPILQVLHVAFFSEYIPYPVKMYHDSETAGFAEIWRTTDRGNMIYLNLNSTTGSSFF